MTTEQRPDDDRPDRRQVRGTHAPELPTPSVDIAAITTPGGEPWARTDRILSRGAAQRRARLEQLTRERQQRDER